MSIKIQNVTKRFGTFAALDKRQPRHPGRHVARAARARRAPARRRCCGSSPGWRWPTPGKVLRDGEDITNQSARDRKIGFVFQHYALFRHMTVAENIAYGLRVRKRPRS